MVESIVSKKESKKGEVLYEIKWKNWASKDNTWEPVENLSHCKKMVADFEKEQALTEELEKKVRP